MQDRYAGDIGDFGKFGLLNELKKQGLSVGINWYKTGSLSFEKNPDGTYKQNDGKYKDIPEKYSDCDRDLVEKLIRISSMDRTLRAVEEANVLPDTFYFDEPVPLESRKAWHSEALAAFKNAKTDLVFLDPDNGLLVPSVKENNPRSVKYVFYDEVLDYLKQGQSVLVYNHRSRKPELQYFREIESRLQEKFEKQRLEIDPQILEISFPRYTIRDYFAISVCKSHTDKISRTFSSMLSGKWGQEGLCVKPITMDITYMEYRNRFKNVKQFNKHYRALPEDIVRAMIERTPDINTTVRACMFSVWRNK